MAGKVIFFVLAIFVGMVWSDMMPTKEEYDNLVMNCHKMYPIEDNELGNLAKNIYTDDADRLQKCFMRCFLDSMKMLDQNGNFDIQRIYDITMHKHKDQLKEDPMNAIKECTKDSGETHPCSKAYAAVKCIGDKKLW